MSIEIVDQKVKQQIDQIASIKKSVASFMQTILATTPDGTPVGGEMPTFWNIVDSANDQDYENTVKGQDLTDLDQNLLKGGSIGSALTSWFDYHESYYQLRRGYSNGFAGWLNENHLRVSEDFNAAYEEARGIGLDPQYVFMDDAGYALATITGTTVALQNSGFIKTGSGDTKIAVTMASGASTGPATVSLVLGDQTDEVTRSIDVVVPSGTDVNDEIVVGQVTPSAITTGTNTHILTVPNIVNFKANTYVIINNVATSAVEYVLVSAVTPTSGGAGTLTVPTLIMNTTVANLRVAPTFDQIVSATISAAVGNLKVYTAPDRTVTVY